MLKKTLNFLFAVTFLCSFVTASGPATAADDNAAGLRLVEGKNTFSISDGDRPLLRYRYGDVRKKPYVDQLFSPSGIQILRDGAPDHVHHHALMFAIRVDGVANFWEETTPDAGTQKHRSLKEFDENVADGVRRAGFTEELDWLPPKATKPVLVEHREIAAYKSADLGATLVEWKTRLELPPGKDSAVLTGSHYNGLGMRFVPSMDHVGRYFAADGNPGKAGPNDSRLTATRWVAYTAKAGGKPVTVALFDHPTSYRHPAIMFTKVLSPRWYSFLSATMNEWKKPITMKPGSPVEVRYAVALWDGEVDPATVERVYQHWAK
ncbi:MAG: DUF6807 family protein [Thermoguttaceae bacterium]